MYVLIRNAAHEGAGEVRIHVDTSARDVVDLTVQDLLMTLTPLMCRMGATGLINVDAGDGCCTIPFREQQHLAELEVWWQELTEPKK